jgi:ferrous iron transport protein B
MRVALVGNPNSGKTTLFNTLTGTQQFVGNWPGVTVQKKEGRIRGRPHITLIDLPGVYSLSPYSMEEILSRDFLLHNPPDVILNIVDGTNLERNLYLTTQLQELGIPTVVAVNFLDVLEKQGDAIHIVRLSQALRCPVVGISALKGTGIQKLLQAVEAAKETALVPPAFHFASDVETALDSITQEVLQNIPPVQKRWYAVKIFERDEKTRRTISLAPQARRGVENLIRLAEAQRNDDAQSIISGSRYDFVQRVVTDCCHFPSRKRDSISDQIDRVLTHRVFALPIFAAVIFLIYYISVSSLGKCATDWMNNGVFGGGWSLFGLSVPSVRELIGASLHTLRVASWMQSLILDGLVTGVGTVLGFVPQLLILFTFLGFLEACGYMARIAFILDSLFRRFGLSGKSFIPFLLGTGCGVPGIMATRTIENPRDRRLTIITTTFMPCSAKIPVIVLVTNALFGGAWWMAPAAYLLGVAAILLTGTILKKTKTFQAQESPFVMELPPYHAPAPANILRGVWERTRSFIKKAGSVILLASGLVWFLSSYGFIGGQFGPADTQHSLLAALGEAVKWIFTPLGFGTWQASVAVVTGLVAKENIVSSMAVLYGGGDRYALEVTLAQVFTQAAGAAFLVFNLLCAPCFAAVGAIRREMRSAKWLAFALLYQTAFAYIAALIVYQLGTWLGTGVFSAGTAVALSFFLFSAYMVLRHNPQKNSIRKKYEKLKRWYIV